MAVESDTTEVTTSSHSRADPRISCALDLGWRIAALYAGVTSYERTPAGNGLLPTASSLAARDRLELELLAAVGYVGRLGISLDGDQVDRLNALARQTDEGNGTVESEFRAALRETHVWLDKQLWRHSEREGRAYELGIMLFDTWSRLQRAYDDRDRDREVDVTGEWREVFGEERVRYLLTLIDDLQSRLDPGAVTVVRDTVEAWRARVQDKVGNGELPPMEQPWQEVRNQAVVWRQLLSGDKEPEAYLGPRERAEVRDELMKLMFKRYRQVIACVGAVIVGVVSIGIVVAPAIATWYEEHPEVATVLAGGVASVATVFGVSKASIARAARNSLRIWSELLWNRALARTVSRETLRVDNVFPVEHTLRGRFAEAAGRRWRRPLARLLRRPAVRRRPRPSH